MTNFISMTSDTLKKPLEFENFLNYLKNKELSLSNDKLILADSNSNKENIWYLNNIITVGLIFSNCI